MKRFVCKYSVIQFVPYAETGEFANVGILLVCEDLKLLDFQLEARKTSRYTSFFKNLTASYFRFAIQNMRDEIERVRKLTLYSNTVQVTNAFEALTHPREAVLRFSKIRTVLTADPKSELANLFEHYVQHDFTKTPGFEKQMEGRIEQWLKDLPSLKAPFKQKKVGDNRFTVEFPLVQTIDDEAVKVIKPFFLGHDTSKDIYRHADTWLAKLRRLKDLNLMPKSILFAIEGPNLKAVNDEESREEAFQKVCEGLEYYGDITPKKEKDARERILEFATS